jgi:hypothetical protein
MSIAKAMNLDADTVNDCLVDLPAFDTSVDLDNAKFMDHIRQVFSPKFYLEMDALMGGDK